MIKQLEDKAALVGGTPRYGQPPAVTPTPAARTSDQDANTASSLDRIKAMIAAALAIVAPTADGSSASFTLLDLNQEATRILDRHKSNANRVEALAGLFRSGYETQASNRDRLLYLVDPDPSLQAFKELAEFFIRGRFERQGTNGQHKRSNGQFSFFHLLPNDAETQKAREQQENHERSRERQGKPAPPRTPCPPSLALTHLFTPRRSRPRHPRERPEGEHQIPLQNGHRIGERVLRGLL